MVFHLHGLHLSREQAKKLAYGHGIRIAHKHLKGPHRVYLTHTQLHRLAKAHKEGKGAMIKMSLAQLRHNRKHGAGFFSNIASSLAKKAVSAAVNKGLPMLANAGVNALQGAINKKLGGKVKNSKEHKHHEEGSGFFDSVLSGLGSVAQQAAPLLLNAGIKKLTGVGIRKKEHKKKHKTSKHHGGSFSPAGY